MAYGLIALIILLAIFGFGFGGGRLVERKLDGVGSISLPASVVPWGHGKARDEDPARLYFRFGHEYPWWISMGSGSAYKQIVCVSFFTPTAGAADYEAWPPRFEPLYRDLKKQRTLTLGTAQLEISGGHYAQNALDEPSHVYLYWDPSRRLQIAWHAADKVIKPDDAVKMIQAMAASFKLVSDPQEKFTEMGEREAREQKRAANAERLARETLAKAGFGAAAPGKPVYANGVYVEWMNEPEPRFQFVKPLGLVRNSGLDAAIPRRPEAAGLRATRGHIGWRRYTDEGWISHNRDNAYLPLPGIERALAKRQTGTATTLYYFSTTVRVAEEDEAAITALGSFFEELPAIERAWQQGKLLDGERTALPETAEPTRKNMSKEPPHEVPEFNTNERSAFGINLQTGDKFLDPLRRRLAAAAYKALPEVRAGHFDAADAAVLAVDRDIQASVMLGAMYTSELRAAVDNGEKTSRPEFVTALYERALRWRLSSYPEPHTQYEADDYAAGREADRAELDAVMSGLKRKE